MGLHRLIGMRIGVADPRGLGDFYGELGLVSDGGDGFGAPDAGTQVWLEEAPFRRLLEIRIGADDDGTVASTARRLAEHGLSPSSTDDALIVVDPVTRITFRIEVADRWEQPPAPDTEPLNRPAVPARRNRRAPTMLGDTRPPRRLGHVVIGTPDWGGTRDLLLLLGCKVSDQAEDIIGFLRCSTDHHNVGIVPSPVPMLQHYSWECDDVDHVGRAASKLVRADESRHVWGFGRHFVGSNYYWYLREPSGSYIELYSDMDVIDDDDEWETAGRTAYGLEHLVNSWGPGLPAEFIAPADLPELEAGWANLERR